MRSTYRSTFPRTDMVTSFRLMVGIGFIMLFVAVAEIIASSWATLGIRLLPSAVPMGHSARFRRSDRRFGWSPRSVSALDCPRLDADGRFRLATGADVALISRDWSGPLKWAGRNSPAPLSRTYQGAGAEHFPGERAKRRQQEDVPGASPKRLFLAPIMDFRDAHFIDHSSFARIYAMHD